MYFTDSLLYPSNVSLTSVNGPMVVFTWESGSSLCPDVLYEIMTNCTSCPSSTQSTFVTCNISTTDLVVCSFAIRTIVCGDMLAKSDEVIVYLKGKLYLA